MTNPFEKLSFLTQEQKEQLLEYAKLLREENQKVNLLSRSSIEELEYRHIAFCASIGAYFTPDKSAIIADVGTGGGLPGLVMAILFPQAKFDLLDGVGKKAAAVNRIIEKMGLTNAIALQARIEERKAIYDYIVGRSVCSLFEFIKFSHKAVARGQRGTLENGVIYFKGGDWEQELSQKDLHSTKTLELDKFFDDEAYIGKSIVHVSQTAIYKAFKK